MTWQCARRAPRGGMTSDPYAGTELGYDQQRIAEADPYIHWCYIHFCTLLCVRVPGGVREYAAGDRSCT